VAGFLLLLIYRDEGYSCPELAGCLFFKLKIELLVVAIDAHRILLPA